MSRKSLLSYGGEGKKKRWDRLELSDEPNPSILPWEIFSHLMTIFCSKFNDLRIV